MLLDISVGDAHARVCWCPTAPGDASVSARSALSSIANEGLDVAAIRFPHRLASIAHSGGVAVAALADPHAGLTGTGVDFEPLRTVRRALSRFYLTSDEEEGLVSGDDALLRLWTVKEALYKATPDNAKAVLVDFVVADPHSLSGTASYRRWAGHNYQYTSLEIAGGWLTVALCRDRRVADDA